MNYDKLSRSLRYYYEKGIMQKVKTSSLQSFSMLSLQLHNAENYFDCIFSKCLFFTLFFFKVAGERYVYKFVCDPEALFSMAFPDNQRPSIKADPDGLPVVDDEALPITHYDEGGSYLVDGGEQCITGMPFPDGYVY